ncbi:unnamed protein product [Meganyctiphanes norvegica]|uniref:Uncharacterized protein n=1 Tax=Meganyctiphanes norvegica TaxID=48144 RepID=A0AAV2RJ24_MEGNR
MCAFWNKLKSNNHVNINSKLKAKDFADFYSSTMTDSNDLTAEQAKLSQSVRIKASALSCICPNTGESILLNNINHTIKTEMCLGCGHTGKQIDLITPDLCISELSVTNAIKSLKKSPSSGRDGITVSHLFHALSEPLIKVLCELYSAIITTSTIPDIFEVGIIIPILKKIYTRSK